jgi:hypothetical protein
MHDRIKHWTLSSVNIKQMKERKHNNFQVQQISLTFLGLFLFFTKQRVQWD